ncbi:MAG: TonB-dependent receptor [Chitinophagales bacterium]|nr:TonB-dependent receptor [Chitinophagales bacterium]
MRKFALMVVSFFLFIGQLLSQNSRTVTGKVTDEAGAAIANASVVVKGTTIGTTTANDGTFSLKVPETAKRLIISSVNHETVEVSISSSSNVSVRLQSTTSNLEEVVVVGYGVQKKKEVTGSISKVNPAPIATLVTPSIDKQLGGRASGVLVTNSSGLVNAPPRIRIRGVNSINGSSSPLFVLDGVPMESGGFAGYTNDNLLSNINSADVESIEVLKDGSATAIYGSRAANGVIMITTKKGKAGKLNVNYSFVQGFSKPSKKFDLLNAQEFVTIANEKLTNAGQAAAAFMNSENTNTDWQAYVYRKSAKSSVHNLSIDGGTDKTTYFVSLNYTNQQGLVFTNTFKRYNIRANIEQKVNKWLKISNYITLSRTEDSDQNNGGNSLSGATANVLRALPNVRVMNPALPQFDYFNVTPDGAALGSDANTKIIENNYTNIAYVLAKNKFSSKKHRVINNLGVEIKPLSWLTYNFKANIDYINLDEYLSYDPKHGDGRGSLGRVQNQAANQLRYTLQNYFNISKSFKQHNIYATLGYENQMQTANSFQAIGTNISDPFFQQTNVISNSYGTQQSSGSYSDGPGFVSYFGRLNYDYNGTYFVSVSLRRDGLSRFAKDNRFGTFPGFSLGYRVSNEEFWKKSNISNVINEFRVRASWARVGNADIAGGGFPFLSLYGSAPYGALSGIAAAQAGNPGLQWETNDKLGFGFDVGLLNNRLNITFDYYKNNNNNLVLAAPQPPSFGVPGNQIYQNIGNMENKGIELAINANIIRQKDFSWDFGVNFTTQNNIVKSLYLDQDVIVTNGTGNYNILRVGQPINALYGYHFAGVNSTNGNPVYYKADGTLVMGNITNSSYFLISDINSGTVGAASTLAASDRDILGSSLPKWFGGITSTIRYKQFTFDMLWRFSGGNKIMNLTKQESLLNQGFMNNGTAILDRWTKPGDVTSVPRLWYGRDNFTNLNQQAVDRFVESGNFFRLDNLQISYDIEGKYLNKWTNSYVKSFRIFVQGQNLLLITKYKGIDPDNIDSRGLDYNTIPQARTISFGLNVGF